MDSLLLLVYAYGMTCSANYFFFPKVFLIVYIDLIIKNLKLYDFEVLKLSFMKKRNYAIFLLFRKNIMLYLLYLFLYTLTYSFSIIGLDIMRAFPFK